VLFVVLYATKGFSSKAESPNLSILAFNDCYELHPLADGRGGLARFAGVIKQTHKEMGKDRVVTLMAGDFLSPSPLNTAKINTPKYTGTINGRQMVDAFNTMGVEYVAFGNHEFDLGNEYLNNNLASSLFKYLAINVESMSPEELDHKWTDSAIIERGGVKIAIIGLVLDTPAVASVKVNTYSETVQKIKEKLQEWKNEKREYDILIGLTHQSVGDDKKLADDVPEFDIIIGGHEHENQFYVRSANRRSIPVAKADSNIKTYFRHDIYFTLPKDVKERIGTAYNNPGSLRVVSRLMPVDDTLKPDPETQAVCDWWRSEAMKSFPGIDPTVPMAYFTMPVDARDSVTRNQQSSIAQWIAEAMGDDMSRFANKISEDCPPFPGFDAERLPSFFNTGSIRIDDVLQGCLSEYDALRLLPFGNSTYTIRLSGQALKQALESGYHAKGSGEYISWDPDVITLGNNDEFLIGNTPINVDATYCVNVAGYMIKPSTPTYFTPGTFEVIQGSDKSINMAVIDYFQKKFPPANGGCSAQHLYVPKY